MIVLSRYRTDAGFDYKVCSDFSARLSSFAQDPDGILTLEEARKLVISLTGNPNDAEQSILIQDPESLLTVQYFEKV